MIVSVHTPKAGGLSFKDLLECHFRRHFYPDYIDLPANKSLQQNIAEVRKFHRKFSLIDRHLFKVKQIRCIHGHFLPYKYSSLKGACFVTWLRDPLERAASHYYYWKRTYNTKHSAPLHKKVVEENWSLERFCFSDEMKDLYTKFFWGFPKEKFEFIGITEFFEEDVKYFAKEYLNSPVADVPQKNVNPEKIAPYFSDPNLIEDLQSFHSEDYAIYNYALKQREKRRSVDF